MAAGDLVVADWQLEIGGLLTGAGTAYQIGPAGIKGLGNPSAKTQSVQLDGQDGEYSGPAYMGARTLLVAYELADDSSTDVLDALETLLAAWEPTTADVRLYLRIPGWGKKYIVGKPNNFDVDPELARAGVITGVAQFDGNSPRWQT